MLHTSCRPREILPTFPPTHSLIILTPEDLMDTPQSSRRSLSLRLPSALVEVAFRAVVDLRTLPAGIDTDEDIMHPLPQLTLSP